MRELVRALFVRLDLLLVNLCFVEIIDQQFELAAGVDHALRVLVEDLEKFALGGHETTEHENPAKWVKCEADIKLTYCTCAHHPTHRALNGRRRADDANA
ncbi:hypothetical protein BSFA1_12870 [Burkholderia sp. SFA1]|nr:hypothetical protein BSFA1_12870 [Burkholderia sp. SFA1]